MAGRKGNKEKAATTLVETAKDAKEEITRFTAKEHLEQRGFVNLKGFSHLAEGGNFTRDYYHQHPVGLELRDDCVKVYHHTNTAGSGRRFIKEVAYKDLPSL